jgi:hypothetical protein
LLVDAVTFHVEQGRVLNAVMPTPAS